MQPYIYVLGPQPCYRFTGAHYETTLGHHAFFVSHVSFIPSFLSADFTRMNIGENSRLRLIVSRQIRFLNDLSSLRSGGAETFDLRFVSVPQPGQPYSKVLIFFIGKAFDEDREKAVARATELWELFASYFPREDPFNYPLQVIQAVTRADGKIVPDDPALLKMALEPVSLGKDQTRNLLEIRKYEDRDPMLNWDGAGEQFVGYYPHPFRPTLDFSAMSRFLETFAVQTQRCVASICLRPTKLALEEQQSINRLMQNYHRLVTSAKEAGNWLWRYREERFDDLARTFDPLINQRNHLFAIKIQVIGEREAPHDVVAALGSEIMNNTTPEPRLWSELNPGDNEAETAYRNFKLLEYAPWGRSDLESALWRIASLVTSYEAVGAFRLPIPPESGHMPGLQVRDEPFVLPASLAAPGAREDSYVSLGQVLHRGSLTETEFFIGLSQLKRHGLVAGSTGSGKTNTCLHLLTELWRGDPSVPFLVIYPIDKPDYRLLQADPSVREKLLIFTLGDDTTSPFRFNPFAVPPGILVRTHLSLLMRAFSAAFSMWDPLPAVYRAALRRTFEEAGYSDLRTAKGGDPGTRAPLLSRFYEILLETSAAMTRDYGAEAKGNIRQGAEIRIRDLLQNAGHVLNVTEGAPWERIIQHPTVMEVGRVGSTEDTALVMGFLLMSLTSYLSSRRKQDSQPPQHLTLIEEAHRLMSSKAGGGGGDLAGDPRANASEDFANILAEVRGFNEGILIAEQIPTELVSGAVGNTYVKIMHWLEEQQSFELFCEIMNLNPQQREFARTLPTGQAIVRGAAGRPVLVKVNNYLDRFQHEDDTPIIDDSDPAIARFMGEQAAKFGVPVPPVVPFTLVSEAAPAPAQPQSRSQSQLNAPLLEMPLPTCVFCQPLHTKGICAHGQTVRESILTSKLREKWAAACVEALDQADEAALRAAASALYDQVSNRLAASNPGADGAKVHGLAYCYAAHETNDLLKTAPADVDLRRRARALLQAFADRGENA